MAKQGMKRPEETPEKKKRNNEAPVPEIQGKARNASEKAKPIITGAKATDTKVYHTEPLPKDSSDRPISDAYPAIDNDLARDNLENDIPEADLGDA